MKSLAFLLALSSLLLHGPGLPAQAGNQGTVRDIQGNEYRTVIIGSQEWMAGNLRTTAYSNGEPIQLVEDPQAWVGMSSGAYCWYNNADSNAVNCGALYNWYAVNTGRLCPEGWHVPSDREWQLMEGTVDSRYPPGHPVWDSAGWRGYDVGLKLKSIHGWKDGENGTDDFGFCALPTGERVSRGRFFMQGTMGFWWTSTPKDSLRAWYRCLFCFDYPNRQIHPKTIGFSVRCIRDEAVPTAEGLQESTGAGMIPAGFFHLTGKKDE